MSELNFSSLYACFDTPVSAIDCGERCSPFNDSGVPFCCDTRHAVPTLYLEEWNYLQASTDLWHPWQGRTPAETRRLQAETPASMCLVECLGHNRCQRQYRALTCRAFPFFPYIARDGRFIGMTYYWHFEETCWVISNLHLVTPQFQAEFFEAFDDLFYGMPEEGEGYRLLAIDMRRLFGRWHRRIPLLGCDGCTYLITPRDGRLQPVDVNDLPKFGPYRAG
jgi:hypothetical protein